MQFITTQTTHYNVRLHRLYIEATSTNKLVSINNPTSVGSSVTMTAQELPELIQALQELHKELSK